MDYSKIIVTGRITQDSRTFKWKTKLGINFGIACNTGYGESKRSTYYDCALYNGTEAMAKVLTTGKHVLVEGELNVRVKDKEKYITITVSNVMFLESKKGE